MSELQNPLSHDPWPHRIITPWLAVVMIAGGLMVGCADRNRDAVPDQSQTRVPGSAANEVSKATGNTAELGDNAVTTGKIKNALILDPKVGAATIDVDTKDDVVTLSGTVKTAGQKQRAGEIAKNHEGIKSVVNKLVVKS